MIAKYASASFTRYTMSDGVHSVVAGIGTAPSLISPSMATYHSGILGSIRNTRAPLVTPSPFSTLAKRFDCTFKSQKVCCRECSPDGSSEMSASLVLSSAHLSTTSKPKLKYSGASILKSRYVSS